MSTTVRVVRSARGPSAAELARRRAVLDALWKLHLAGCPQAPVSLDLPWRRETKA